MAEVLSGKRLQILNFIADCQRDRGYPPSVREIGEAVGLASSATVHTHLAVLQREGYLSKDPSKPRAIQVHFDPDTSSRLPASAVHNVPLVGEVAAGHRRPGRGEHRGAAPHARAVHRQRALLHAAGARATP